MAELAVGTDTDARMWARGDLVYMAKMSSRAAEAAVQLTDQIADGVLELQRAGGGAGEAHLVLDPGAAHAVAAAEAAIVMPEELGHQEQADPARTRRIRCPAHRERCLWAAFQRSK
jgi:hypothetical protein